MHKLCSCVFFSYSVISSVSSPLKNGTVSTGNGKQCNLFPVEFHQDGITSRPVFWSTHPLFFI